jgi:hypothetical protein
MKQIQVLRTGSALSHGFQNAKPAKGALTAGSWPVFTDPVLDLARVKILKVPKGVHNIKMAQTYTRHMYEPGFLSLDKFACAAIIRCKGALEVLVSSLGLDPLPNLARIVFDGTMWAGPEGVEFPAAAYIDGKYSEDMWPLWYCENQSHHFRAVVVR